MNQRKKIHNSGKLLTNIDSNSNRTLPFKTPDNQGIEKINFTETPHDFRLRKNDLKPLKIPD